MYRIIDWFRKPAIMKKLYLTGGDWDGDLVVYKHHKYYANVQTGVVMRIEQHDHPCKGLKHTHFVWVCWRRNYESIKTDI